MHSRAPQALFLSPDLVEFVLGVKLFGCGAFVCLLPETNLDSADGFGPLPKLAGLVTPDPVIGGEVLDLGKDLDEFILGIDLHKVIGFLSFSHYSKFM